MMIRLAAALCLLAPLAHAGDGSKKSLEEFRQAMKEAKGFPEKALLIQGLAAVEPRDPAAVAALARYLNPHPADTHLLLPTATVESLGRFRGERTAAQVLQQALTTFRKNPYLTRRLILALARVGHDSALPVLEGHLLGLDSNLAALAVEAMADLPAPLAIESLIRGWEQLEDRKKKSGDDFKKVYDQLVPNMVKLLRRISDEKWISPQEFQIWWRKRGAEFREKHKEAPAAAPARTTLPPVLLVEMLFNDKGSGQPLNTGATCGSVPTARLTGAVSYSDFVSANAGPSALDWGVKPGSCAVDLGAVDALRNLKSFTITGWLNCRASAEGTGGNRIVSWSQNGGDGVDLVYRTDGSLQLGVNQWADGSPARSAAGQVPVLPEKPADAIWSNWRFFAVTYDSTLAAGQVKFHFGLRGADAKLDATRDYPRGATGGKLVPSLSVGHVNPASRPMGPDRCFRGLIDEVRIFGSRHDGSGALSLPEILAVQNKEAAP